MSQRRATRRKRRVRFKYPKEVVSFVRFIGAHADRPNIARAFNLPLSTIYRWIPRSEKLRPEHGSLRQSGGVQLSLPLLRSALDECSMKGFDFSGAAQDLLQVKIPCEASKDDSQSQAEHHTGNAENELDFSSEPTLAAVNLQNASSYQLAVPSDDRMLAAKTRIEQRYYTRLSCSDLASAVGMSKFSFIRAFSSAFGCSPYQYVNQVRVDHARHMLVLTREPLTMIAASVGFRSASSLSRAFLRFTGKTSSQLEGVNHLRRDRRF